MCGKARLCIEIWAEATRNPEVAELQTQFDNGFEEQFIAIFEAAKTIDDRTVTLQYFDALKEMGASPSTKYVLPLELTDIAKHLGDFLDRGFDAGEGMRLGAAAKPDDSDSPS